MQAAERSRCGRGDDGDDDDEEGAEAADSAWRRLTAPLEHWLPTACGAALATTLGVNQQSSYGCLARWSTRDVLQLRALLDSIAFADSVDGQLTSACQRGIHLADTDWLVLHAEPGRLQLRGKHDAHGLVVRALAEGLLLLVAFDAQRASFRTAVSAVEAIAAPIHL